MQRSDAGERCSGAMRASDAAERCGRAMIIFHDSDDDRHMMDLHDALVFEENTNWCFGSEL